VPPTAPRVTRVDPDVQPVRNGAPIAVTIVGARFAVGDPARPPVVSLQGTLVRGSVDLPASTPTSLRVTFPATTPAGSYHVVVSNVLEAGNESDVSAAPFNVKPAAAYAPSQLVYVSSDGHGGVTAYEPGGARAVIATQPEAGGLALTPDGRRGVVQQLYSGAQPDCDVLPQQYVDLAVFDLDPASPSFRQVVANLPFVLGGFESPAVTPNPNNPQGVFAWVPTRFFSDTVAVIDPVAGVELDLDGNPATQTYPSAAVCDNFDIGSKLPGVNRIELDGDGLDLSLTPLDAALTPDGDRLYVANSTGSVSIVDTATRSLRGRWTFDGNRADGDLGTLLSLAASPDGAFVYVSGNDSTAQPFVFVYNVGVDADVPAALAERFALPTAPLGEIGRGMVVSPDGGTVYLAARVRGQIYALDVRPGSPTRGQVTALSVGLGVSQLAVAPDDGLLYALNVFRDELYVLDIRRASPTYHQVLTTLGTPLAPSDVAVQTSLLRPRVAGVSPAAGPTAGGTPVVIVGAGFVAGAGVTFAGVPRA
jgi:DNA-binding beta-propeller fold protein YncE